MNIALVRKNTNMERPVNNSEKIAAAFCKALDAGTRVTGSVAVATGAVGGIELVRHFDTLGIVRPIDIVDAQGNCIVELKKAEVGAKTPDGQIRAIAGRNFTLSAAGRTYPTESDNTGKLTATSRAGGKTDTFKFEGNSTNGEMQILITDTEATDKSRATKTANVDCNIKTDLKVIFETPPSNATPGSANIVKPNEAMVTKPANLAPAAPNPESKPTTAPAKPVLPNPNVFRPNSEAPTTQPSSSESTPKRGLLSGPALDRLLKTVDDHPFLSFAFGVALMAVGEWGTSWGRNRYNRWRNP
jgi:hypothetical protein